MRLQQPVIIEAAMNGWPAMGIYEPSRAWKNLDYLCQVAGERTVPVEVSNIEIMD